MFYGFIINIISKTIFEIWIPSSGTFRVPNSLFWLRHFQKLKIYSKSCFWTKSLKKCWAFFFFKWYNQDWKILFSQLLVGQSQTLKYQNGVEFDFQSICKHHRSLWREKGVICALLAPFLRHRDLWCLQMDCKSNSTPFCCF